jgi:hypothetical protein
MTIVLLQTIEKLAAACTGHKGGTGDDSPPAIAEERCKSGPQLVYQTKTRQVDTYI